MHLQRFTPKELIDRQSLLFQQSPGCKALILMSTFWKDATVIQPLMIVQVCPLMQGLPCSSFVMALV